MNSQAPVTAWALRVLERTALVLCLPEERQWISALFHEFSAVEGKVQRLRWIMGLSGLLGFSIRERGAIMLSSRLNQAIFVAFLGMLSCGVVSQAGYEGAEGLDDSFLGLALVFGAIFAGLVALGLGRFMVRAWNGADLREPGR